MCPVRTEVNAMCLLSGDQAGSLYDHPKVHLVLQEGRNFIERSPEQFDLIVLGFVLKRSRVCHVEV